MSETEKPPPGPTDPVQRTIHEIEGASNDGLRGNDRLGALAFNENDVSMLREIARVLQDAEAENQAYWSLPYRSEFSAKAEAIGGTVRELKSLRSDSPDAADRKTQILQQLQEHFQYVMDTVKPRLIEKRVREAIESAGPGTEAAAQRQHDLEQRNELLRHGIEVLEQKLSELEPIVEAQRAAAAADTTEELSHEYLSQAKTHLQAWKTWLWVLAGSGVVAIGGGILLVALNRPSGDDFDAASIARLALDIYVIGLLLYAVRIASLQFRVHRHLEAKARSKAAALSTFSRFVGSGAEPSTRDVVAQTLAQAVFESGDTGFVDSKSDQITLIERVIGPAVQRVSP